jgi:hypothetical protein
VLGDKGTLRGHRRSVENDLGRVKTRKTEKGRERLFSAQPKSNALINLQACKRDLEERLFYRRRSSPRFYTAKTQCGHADRIARCSERPLSVVARPPVTNSCRNCIDSERTEWDCTLPIIAAATARLRAMPSRSTLRQAMSAFDASAEINRKRASHD